MDHRFFERPILNSPYDYPAKHWELDKHCQSEKFVKAHGGLLVDISFFGLAA